MLQFHAIKHDTAPAARLVELLRLARTVLAERGMASMDEYGDLLQWALPREEDVW